MKHKIKNIETLIYYIDKHFNTISDAEFNDIVRITLGVYSDGKGTDKAQTIKQIIDYWTWIKTNPIDAERPLFWI